MNNFKKFNPTISEDGRVFIGANDCKGKPIKELDVLFFDGLVKEYYFVEWDDYFCAFKLRSSVIYGGRKEFKNGGEIVGCILDYELKEPAQESHNTTTTYQKWSNKINKEILKSMGIK